MISPSPQCVGQEFVRQYYTMLHEAPDFMHRFYSHDSSFIHGGHEDGSVHGQINIHKKILSLNFRDCHARIRQVDSLGTIDDAVVVQVSGELSNDGRPMRRFVQTFVLAPQSPKKYYVHNDIFRYQDEVFVEDCDLSGTTPCTSTADSPESCCSSSISKSQEHQNSSDQSVHTASLNSPSKGMVIQSPVTPPGRNDDPPGSEGGERDGRPTKTDGGEGNESSNGHGRESATAREVSNDPGRDRKDDESHCGETKGCKNGQMATAPPCPGGKTPQSWASVTSSKKLQSTMQSYGFAEDGETSDRDGVGNGGFRLSRESPSVSFPPASTGQEDCRMSEIRQEIVREEKLDGRTVRSAEASRHQDPIQLFIGNLPNDVAASTLRKIFNKFGEVLDVRINRKVSANRDVPNFGFLSLDTLDTARKILEARPFHLDNGHRLNVEEKKSDQARLGQSDAGVRQRSRPTPTTRPSSSGRGRWGGYRGGEGRSGSSSKSFDRFGSGPSGGFEGKVGRE